MLARLQGIPLYTPVVTPCKQIRRRCVASRTRKCTVLAGKQKPSTKGNKPAKRSPRKFEQLMLDWDDVFDSMCKDPAKARQMELQAASGWEQHGRGFLLVKSKVMDAPKATSMRDEPVKGFGGQTDTPPTSTGQPLLANPALLELSWSAVYVPALHLPSLGGTLSRQGAPLPSPSQLVKGGAADDSAGDQDLGNEDDGRLEGFEGTEQEAVDRSVLEELQRAMRGMDGARLAYLVGVSMEEPEAYPLDQQAIEVASELQNAEKPPQPANEGGATPNSENMQPDDTGERPYQPELREFVVLLLANIEKQPAIGADIVVAVGAEGEEGGVQLLLPGLMAFPELA